jgi:molecular chaperone GrpE
MTGKNSNSKPEKADFANEVVADEAEDQEELVEESAENDVDSDENHKMEAEELDGQEAELLAMKKELDDMKNRYYRALADYQNLQRRSAKEILEARNRGIEDFVKKLLPVVDTMEKAIEQIAKMNVDKKVMDGLEMFSIQFTDMLEKEGLQPINATGQKFDPNFHEALCKKTDENIEDEIVTSELERGYTFKERVLRTAKVEINQR